MNTAPIFQHIWKCFELRLSDCLDRIFFVNVLPVHSIYKWIAFTWLAFVGLSLTESSFAKSSASVWAGDSSLLELNNSLESNSFGESAGAPGLTDEEALACCFEEEIGYSETAIACGVDFGTNEIWEISTRQLPQSGCMAVLDPHKLRVSRWMPSCGWIESSFEQYLASVRGSEKSSDSGAAGLDLHNIVYVHGNWMPADLTRERGLLIGRYLAQRAHLPFRLTVFSWPSTREKHALADIRENAVVAEVQGLYLGTLLQHFPADKPLGIIGFSYGARAVTGSLHALGGGTLCGRTLSTASYPQEIRVSFMAAAIDRAWMLEGGRHQNAARTISSIVNLYNSNDPILRRYHLISTSHRGTAAGVAGLILPRNWLNLPPGAGTTVAAPNHVRLRQYDCRGDLGRSHDERSYYRECSCTVHLLDHVLWNDGNELHVSNHAKVANESTH
jgi:hypothetical protein